jgi:uncharacterized protein YkwD
MITRRSLFILPTTCLILAGLLVGFAISQKGQKGPVNSAAASSPPGQRVLTALTFEPRGAPAETAAPTTAEPLADVPKTSPPPTKQSSKTVVTPKAAPKTAAPTPAKATCSGNFTTQFICLLNEYRSSKGLNKLSYSSAMTNVATNYSAWMNKTGTFSHTGENGSRFTDRCSAAGIKCYGENLAQGFRSPQNLLDMWKASASHNANMLRNGYTAVGLGISGSYATALFQ